MSLALDLGLVLGLGLSLAQSIGEILAQVVFRHEVAGEAVRAGKRCAVGSEQDGIAVADGIAGLE